MIRSINPLIVKGSTGLITTSDQKLYFLKGLNPFPLNKKLEENYTFSLFVSKTAIKVEFLDYEIYET